MTIGREDVGAWVLKCDPQRWKIHQARQEAVDITDWSVIPTYRLDLVEPGDPVVLLVTGGRDSGDAGIWYVGRMTGDGREADGGDLWVHRRDRAEQRIYAGVKLVPLDSPLPRHKMTEDPVLGRAEPFRAPQVGNPSYLSPAELQALVDLLGKDPWAGSSM